MVVMMMKTSHAIDKQFFLLLLNGLGISLPL